MKKFIKTFVITITPSLALLMPAVVMPLTAHAAADIKTNLCSGADLKFGGTNCTTNGTAEASVNGIVALIINIFSVVVGVIAVIFIIIGGIKYVTSGGEATNITAAKNTIMYAIVGLVVVALAQILVRFVLNKVNNA